MSKQLQNTADEAQVKEAQGKDKRKADRAKEDLRFVLSSPNGRRVLWGVLEKCRIYTGSADNSGSWTYFNEGRRSVGLDLIADIIAIDQKLFIELQKENFNE